MLFGEKDSGKIVIDEVVGYLVTMTAAQGLGSALGPALAATLIREGGDYSLIMPMAALLCLFGTLMFLFIVWRSARMGATKAA